MTNAVIGALRQYEREQRSKKAVLLTPDGGYYLYENRFCSISDFELTVAGPDLQVQGNSVPCTLFFGLADDTLCWSAKETGSVWPDRLSLIFHIALAGEDGLLRGILFAQGQKAYLTLFTDADTEKLYRAVSAPAQSPPPHVGPEQELTAYAAACARNDLRRLTALYLNGQKLSQLRGRCREMIERLFDGERQYGEPVFSRTSRQIEERRELLKKLLDTEGQAALGRLEDLYIRQNSAMLRDAYADGFSTAVKLLAEALLER